MRGQQGSWPTWRATDGSCCLKLEQENKKKLRVGLKTQCVFNKIKGGKDVGGGREALPRGRRQRSKQLRVMRQGRPARERRGILNFKTALFTVLTKNIHIV